MEFRNAFNRVQLEILSYEFENSMISEDLDWLNIRVAVSTPQFNYQNCGPYLRIVELIKLKKWFELISGEEVEKTDISFLENELAFRYFDRTLEILLNYDLHPNKEYFNGNRTPFTIKFKKNELHINKLLSQIDDFIKNFPSRKINPH